MRFGAFCILGAQSEATEFLETCVCIECECGLEFKNFASKSLC